ncbi:hypothetical protein IPJ70_03715 [Candidatus Campbellbacteria bacterium]|nr:MAG: hypothetical protein IPJ70_03715 [Candidatus Campbellbacteria bacterium]
MNNEFSTIEDQLKKVSVHTLSHEEKDMLWVSVVRAHTVRPVVSPYSWMVLVHRRLMVTVSAVLIFVLAGGSTVALADSAKPGDTLFALDRATENVVLALTSESNKDTVRLAIADERISELESLISDESSRRLAIAAENPRTLTETEAMRAASSFMPATFATDVATNTEESIGQEPLFSKQVAPADSSEEVTQNKDKEKTEVKDKKQTDIEEALSLVGQISNDLEKKGNKKDHDSVRRAMKRLSGKLDKLPSEKHDVFKESFKNISPEVDTAFQPEENDDEKIPQDEVSPIPPSTEDPAQVGTTTQNGEGGVQGESIHTGEKIEDTENTR